MVATVVLNVKYKPDYADEYSPATTFRGQSMNVNASVSEKESNQIAIDAMKNRH